jgi:hypothetical protein
MDDRLLPQSGLDPQQTQLVIELEQRANDAQWHRNADRDRFELADYHAKQPNRIRWRKQRTAFLMAGLLGLTGTLYGWQRRAYYWIPLSLGFGFGIGRVSVVIDDRRQSREKQEWLSICRYEFQRADSALEEAVTLYREAEETRWLMYALNIPKTELFALRNWMAEPRRTIKDSLLESLDLVNTQVFQQPFALNQSPELARERQFRQWRNRLLSQDLQLQKEEFMHAVVAKHNFRRHQELETLAKQSRLQRAIASTTGGLGVGLATGAGVSAMGANLVSALGASEAALSQTLAVGGMAAAVGVGLFAARQIQHWMLQSEAERRQREARQYQESFRLSTLILETLLTVSQMSERPVKKRAILETLDAFKQLKRQKIEEPLLKGAIQDLGDRLRLYLQLLEQQP